MRDRLVIEADRGDHIARHGVDLEEVFEVFYSRHVRSSARAKRIRVIGQTVEGRYLTLLVGRRGPARFGLITARDADESERRLFRRTQRR